MADHEQELTGDEHDEIRRLLAQARYDDPMPADVAARMDAVLADLGAETDSLRPAPAPVTSLAAHRRRRAGGLLVAAATIVIAGVAISQHRPEGGNSSAATGAAMDRSAAGDAGTSSHAAGPSPSSPHSPSGASALSFAQGRVVVHARSFPADATAAKRLLKAPSATPQSERSTSAEESTEESTDCVSLPADSASVPATFQQAPALLVYLQPEGDTQVVDLYLCGHPKPIRSVTLPAH